jgi:hypothetical protein
VPPRVTTVRHPGSSTARSLRVTLADGARTTVHVVEHDRRAVRLRVVRMPGLTPLEGWCRANDVEEALVGGFYLRGAPAPTKVPGGDAPARATGVVPGRPLGELRVDGAALPSVPFLIPWDGVRACVHATDGDVRIRRRGELPAEPGGDLLQAGPLLVRDGVAVRGDHEGFSAGSIQFDSDITAGRHPRAALGVDGRRLIAVACEGRADDEAGLAIDELADVLVALGAREALNLDGGGSTALVSGGRLRNVAREAHGVDLPGGRAIATALVFAPA